MKYLLLLSVLLLTAQSNAKSLLSAADFLAQHNMQHAPVNTLWLNAAQQKQIADILSHTYAGIRIRYWQQDGRRVFILNEVGKELPITFGLVAQGPQLIAVEVLEFRESRGDEIKSEGFRAQFAGIALNAEGELNRHVDGISGATYSVRAMQKIVKLTLYLQQQLDKS
jgi:Na+-translocating ferredoxin:NAD+ oxidoreductase RnfG subunit